MDGETRESSGRPPENPERMDTDGFVIPTRKRGRGRPRKNKNIEDDQQSVDSFATDNTFGSLNDDDAGDNEIPNKRNRLIKIKRPPPITIPNLNYKAIDENIKQLTTVKHANITKRITKEGVKLFVTNNEEFRSMRKHLDQSSTKYTTYTLDEDKLSMYVMYGLPHFPLQEVQAEFAAVFHIKPHVVKYMKIAKKLYPEQANYLIYFRSNQNVHLDDLKKITGLLGFHVFFEKYRRSTDPCQCFNCQGFTHASANCTLDPRCVRCSGPHKSSDCQLIDKKSGKIPTDKVKCANCSGAHTASSRECPVRIKLMNQRQAMSTQRARNTQNTRYVRQYSNYNTNFPALSGMASNDVNKQYRATVNQGAQSSQAWFSNTTQLFTQPRQDSNLLTPRQLMNVFREMVRICSTCRSKEEQLDALTAIVEKYVIND